jgi:hypothetical protein
MALFKRAPPSSAIDGWNYIVPVMSLMGSRAYTRAWSEDDIATVTNMIKGGKWGVANYRYEFPPTPENIAACDVMGIGINRGRIITRVHNGNI